MMRDRIGVDAAIRGRRTVRRFAAEPLPRDAIERLIEAAVMAPSPHNSQPWRFAVVTAQADRRRLATAMAEAWRADLERDGTARPLVEARVGASIRTLSAVPALVVVCLAESDLDPYPDAKRQSAELAMGAQAVGAAIQNLLLSAHAAGIGAGWRCAPLFCPEVVRDCLGLPPDWSPQALVLLGYPAEQPPASGRKRVPDVSFFVESTR